MAEICSCESGIVNFGQPNCNNAFKRASRLIFVNYLNDSGAVNSIESTDTLDATFFDGKFNGAVDQRWYYTDTINDVDGERADAVTQESDGINFFVKQGTRSFNGNFWGNIASPKFIESLDSVSCRQMGLFIVDVAGNIIGVENTITGDLDPIKIQRNTFQNKYMFPTATTLQGINLKFDWEENVRDSSISFVGSNNILVDMLEQRAMSTVVLGTAASISTTSFTTQIDFTYGQNFDKLPHEGAVIGEFVLTEISPTPGAVTITTVVESTSVPGFYTVTYPAATTADVYELSYSKTTGTGFESIVNLSITIP